MEIFVYIPILLLAVAVPFFAMMLHNSLVAARNHTREAWVALDAALRRRYAFAANFAEVAVSRDRCMANHGPISSRAHDEREFVTALRSVIAIHPELRVALSPFESTIHSASQSYNAAADIFRRKCETFPHSLIASLFGFNPPASFEVAPVVEGLGAGHGSESKV